MNALKNNVQLIGRVNNPPLLRTTARGRKWARFGIATDEIHRNTRGDKIIQTQWHNLVAWDGQAEIAAKFLRRGTELVVEGKLVAHTYTGREGRKKRVTEVLIIYMLMPGLKEYG